MRREVWLPDDVRHLVDWPAGTWVGHAVCGTWVDRWVQLVPDGTARALGLRVCDGCALVAKLEPSRARPAPNPFGLRGRP